MKKFVFFYLMKKRREKMKELVPKHIEYWKRLKPDFYMGAPFSDKSGGLILFYSDSMEAAEKTAFADPFIKEDVIEERWVKEWMVEVD